MGYCVLTPTLHFLENFPYPTLKFNYGFAPFLGCILPIFFKLSRDLLLVWMISLTGLCPVWKGIYIYLAIAYLPVLLDDTCFLLLFCTWNLQLFWIEILWNNSNLSWFLTNFEKYDNFYRIWINNFDKIST